MAGAPHPDITWHAGHVTTELRTGITRARGTVVWLTGLSGCGKSTIATALEAALIARGALAYVLDGDNVRHGLNSDLGFAAADRTENIRRIGEVAKLLADAQLICIASFISPYRADRAKVRALLPPDGFLEVFVDAPVDVCAGRDPKGLYKKAYAAVAAGRPMHFTGVDAPYEPPERPELHLKTAEMTSEQCVAQLLRLLTERQRLRPTESS